VDRTGSGSCPVAEFGISGVELLYTNTRGLIINLYAFLTCNVHI
jgi:hypothetical protein